MRYKTSLLLVVIAISFQGMAIQLNAQKANDNKPNIVFFFG